MITKACELSDQILDLADEYFHVQFPTRAFVAGELAVPASCEGLRGSDFGSLRSSAKLAAFSALTSPKLGDRTLKPGDEVITLAAGFPTPVNPSSGTGVSSSCRCFIANVPVGCHPVGGGAQ
jgi:hypothetical protein